MIHFGCGTCAETIAVRGERLYWRPEFAMFGLGQHCCPNFPLLVIVSVRRGWRSGPSGSAADGRGRVGRRQK